MSAPSVVETQIAKTSASASSVQTSAFAANPVTGDAMVVCQSTFNASQPTHTAPTDTAGNPYTQVGPQVNFGNYSLSQWRAENIVGGSSFQVTGKTAAAVSNITIVVYHLTGQATPTSYNGDVVSTTGNSQAASPGTTSPGPSVGSLFIGMAVINLFSGITDPSGWTAVDQPNNSTFVDLYTAWQQSVAAQTPTWTWSGANTWGALCASYASPSPAGGGGGGGSGASSSASVSVAGALVVAPGPAPYVPVQFPSLASNGTEPPQLVQNAAQLAALGPTWSVSAPAMAAGLAARPAPTPTPSSVVNPTNLTAGQITQLHQANTSKSSK